MDLTLVLRGRRIAAWNGVLTMTHEHRPLNPVLLSCACALLLLAPLVGVRALAEDPTTRGIERFTGYIRMAPRDGVGTWRIGSRTINSTPLTIIDDTDGALVVGTCVQVDMLRRKVLRIDSLQSQDC